MNSIDILISTYDDRIYEILPHLKELKGIRYLIGHQNYEQSSVDKSLFGDYIIYYPLDSKGVTLSRNFLIEKATSDIIYFCDDDISFLPNALNKLIEIHAEREEDIIITCVLNENYVPRKKYPLSSVRLKRTRFFSVGTVEISAKREKIQSNNIKFCEDMGAGNKQFPIGDEAIFLADAYDAGLSIITYPLSLIIHPQESSGLNITDETLNSIGLSIKRVYKRKNRCLSWIVLSAYLVRFLLRRGPFYSKSWHQIKLVFQGYNKK